MDYKGIFNIELLFLFIILLIIFSMLISISLGEFSSIEETQNRKESRIIVSDINKIINEVYIGGEGYKIRYNLPLKINKETYVLKINKTGIYINSHYQMTYSQTISYNNINVKQMYLEPGNVYEFINNNNSIDIVQNI